MENTPNNTNTPVSGQTSAKKNTGLIVLTAIFGLTAVILAVLLVLKNDKGGDTVADNSDAKCIVTQEQIDNPEEGSVAEAVAEYNSDQEIRNIIKGISKRIVDEMAVGGLKTTFDSGFVVANLDVDNAYVTMTKSYGVYYSGSWSEENDKVMPGLAQKYLIDQGFEYNHTAMTYDKGTYRCGLSEGYPFYVDCADTAWLSESNKELAEKLATAYRNKTGDTNTLVLSSVDKDYLKTSSDGEVEYLKAATTGLKGIGGGVAFFYRLTSSDEWTFVTGGNGIPACSDFDENAKKVFGEFSCNVDGYTIKKVGE